MLPAPLPGGYSCECAAEARHLTPLATTTSAPRGAVAPARFHNASIVPACGPDHGTLRQKTCLSTALSPVEPAGIEPATSCLQSRSDCPLVSRSVAQMPANTAFLLATGGHERTARDKLVPPWCPLGVRDLGRREESGPRLPGCVSSRIRPRPRRLLRRRSPSARRAAAYPQTHPSRGHTC